MPSPLSMDLRERVVAAVAQGASCHRAAARFGVSVSSASRWSERFRREGQVAPKPSGGDHASRRIEAHADLILAAYEEEPQIFLHELRDALAEQGVQTSTSGLSRFFARHGSTRKKIPCGWTAAGLGRLRLPGISMRSTDDQPIFNRSRRPGSG